MLRDGAIIFGNLIGKLACPERVWQ